MVKKKKRINIKKQKKIQRIPCGVKGFDSLIEGGFEAGSTNLIVGSSGSGKTIFAIQFLVEGVRRGENVLYITFEEKKEEVYKDMLNFGWDLKDMEKKGKFVFLEYTPEKVKMMLEEGGGAIESVVLKKKITRIVIDSISSFALLFEKESERREAALALFDILKKWTCTSLLTLEENPIEKHKEMEGIEFEADSIILIYFVRKKGESKRERFIEVLKMRGTNHSKEIFPINIGKKGMFVRNSPVSNIK